MLVKNLTRDTILADKLCIADTVRTRMRGLLGRKRFPVGEGLWITPCPGGIHTIGMAFPIDVLFLDDQKTVVRLYESLRPFRLTALYRTVCSVVELPCGTIARTNTQLGDQLTMLSEER